MRLSSGRVAVLASLSAAAVLPAGATLAAILVAGAPTRSVDNYGRAVTPRGRLTELGYFVTGSALTPDGRFLWTVGAGRVHNDVQITRTADGKVIQTFDDPKQALQGGVTIAPDGRAAYVSDTHDGIGVRIFAIDLRNGQARQTGTIGLPPPAGTAPPDDFPPRTPTSSPQSYAAGMALTSDGRTLVVSENLAESAAVIDIATHRITQVRLKAVSPAGNHALPEGVAIIGRRVFIADEGDGTVSSFSLDDPAGTVSAVTPVPARPDPVAIDAGKTHPFAIAAAPDGRHLYLSETDADRVLVLDPSDLSAPAGVIDVRRAEGIGTSPLGLAVAADGRTLFVADANENAVRVIALAPRRIAAAGRSRSVAAGEEIARIPTGIYPDRVEISHAGTRLYVVSAMGTGPGPNGNSSQIGPVGDPEQASIRLLSSLQTIALPPAPGARDAALTALGSGGARAAVPLATTPGPPASTPVAGPDGGPSRQIKYVFYVVAENKTYDSVLGDLTRDPAHPLSAGRRRVGNGDPCLVIFGEFRSAPHRLDGAPCPQSRFVSKGPQIRLNPGQRDDGTPITPNQHRLARQFVTLDNTYADSTTSDDGHVFTASGYPSDYELRGTEANNGPSPRPFDIVYPQVSPPRGFIFDAFARAGVSFFNYGEAVSGTLIPDSGLTPEERAVRARVLANSDYANYPSSAAIDVNPVSASSSGIGGERVDDANQPAEAQGTAQSAATGPSLPPRQSRLLYFGGRFASQVASAGCQAAPADPSVCTVPQFNELILPNNHTAGTTPGRRTPDALVRDNDLAIGQLASLVSHSPIWPYAAIFVVQDDAQDGADHVESHRITSLLISPYARHQAVDSTHYDQAGVLHTIHRILGVTPDYLDVALATPMYNAFTTKPELAPYETVPITQPQLDEINGPRAPLADLSRRQRWQADRVAPSIVNRIEWAYRYGTSAAMRAGR